MKWGWKLDDENFMPIMTDKAPAPDELLNIIRCNCQVTSKNVWLFVATVVGWSVRTVTLELARDDESEEFDNNIFENIFGVWKSYSVYIIASMFDYTLFKYGLVNFPELFPCPLPW